MILQSLLARPARLMMATRLAKRELQFTPVLRLELGVLLMRLSSIIQDCEDALTNWVSANAAVSSKLSTRARNLSQRRKQRTQGEGVDLSGQDTNMQGENRESGLWVPAGAHREYAEGEEEEEEEEEEVPEGHAEHRGREEEQPQAA